MIRDLVIYSDMDGVLADFHAEPNAIERFENEKGFFANLAPIEDNVSALKLLITMGAKVYILSATPNAQADKDKATWLAKYLPEIKKENYIFMRNGQCKADFVRERGILFDDYGKNINEWLSADMVAYKIDKSRDMHSYILELIASSVRR